MADRLIRDRIADAAGVLDRAGLAGRRSGAPARAGRVVDDGAIPTSVPNFFAVAPIGSVAGDECEGCPGSDSPVANAARDYVYVLGPEIPKEGNGLIYYGIGDRWAADFSKSSCVAGPTFDLFVRGCNGSLLLPSASVKFNGTTKTTGSTTGTADFGRVTFDNPGAGTYPLVISASRYDTLTQNLTIACPQPTVSKSLSVFSGYHCAIYIDQITSQVIPVCPYPFPSPLHLTDSVYGSDTLTWDAATLYWRSTCKQVTAVGNGVAMAIRYAFGGDQFAHGLTVSIGNNVYSLSNNCVTFNPSSFLSPRLTADSVHCAYPLNVTFVFTGGANPLYPTGGSILVTE